MAPVSLVTGSNGVVGAACIASLADRGHDCVALDLIPRRQTGNAEYIRCDVASQRSVKRAIESVRRRYGRVDNFIHSAGVQPPGFWTDALSYDLRVWRRVLDVHVTGAMLMSQSLIPLMAQGRCGSIVFLGSIYAVISPQFSLYRNGPSPLVYTASKAALVGMAKWIAVRYGRQGIRCNVVSPGGIEESRWPSPSFKQRYLKQVPLRRLLPVDDVVRTITYALESKHLTGQNLVLDGGWTSV